MDNETWPAFLIPLVGLAFPLIWDHIQQDNRRRIDRMLADGKSPNPQRKEPIHEHPL
jgi:hypothetical protein